MSGIFQKKLPTKNLMKVFEQGTDADALEDFFYRKEKRAYQQHIKDYNNAYREYGRQQIYL